MPEALIWGASGGIGSALVTLLKSRGWRVFAAARDEARIPPEADFTCRFDAGQPHTIDSIPAMLAGDSDGIDLMIYAAGTTVSATVEKLTPADWAQVFDSNVTGAYLAARASLPLMKPGGHLVFIGAYVEHLILPKLAAYAAAKAALAPLAAVLQKENRKLKVTLLRPGPVDTPFWANVPFSLPKDARPPSAIAEAILARYESGESGDLNL